MMPRKGQASKGQRNTMSGALLTPPVRFVARFLGAWLLLCALDMAWARGLNDALNQGLARMLAATLPCFGLPTSLAGSTVHFAGTAVWILDPCNGLQLVEILIAWVWAYPANWNARYRGLLWMIPTISLLNLLRLYSLVPLLIYEPKIAEAAHQYVWQVGMVAATLSLGIAWTRGKGTSSRAVREPAS